MNVAFGKPINATSLTDAERNKTVDGVIQHSEECPTIQGSNGWKVDLLGEYLVTKVIIHSTGNYARYIGKV